MKFFLLISIWAALSGCLGIAIDSAADSLMLSMNEGSLYEPVKEGPMAKLVFSSPQLHEPLTGSIYLNLFVYHRNKNCNFTKLGHIPLTLEERQKSVIIPAGQRMYFRVAYWHRTLSNIARKHRDISFAVDQNTKYEIEHVDNPGNLRVNFFQSDDTSSKQPLPIQDELCFPK